MRPVTAYALGPTVRERVEDGTWVGLLPDGPLILLGGAGEVVLDVLEQADAPLERPRLLAEVLDRFEDAPDSAPAQIEAFVAQLVEVGVIVRAAGEGAR